MEEVIKATKGSKIKKVVYDAEQKEIRNYHENGVVVCISFYYQTVYNIEVLYPKPKS